MKFWLRACNEPGVPITPANLQMLSYLPSFVQQFTNESAVDSLMRSKFFFDREENEKSELTRPFSHVIK